MGVQIKKVAFTSQNYPTLKRSVATLSDGTSVAMVLDMNQDGLTDAGGDETDLPKIYVYTSPDRITWTLKATVNWPGTMSDRSMASISVDNSDNLHVAFKVNDGSIDYVKLTYSAGPSYSVGSREGALPVPPANTTYQRMDLDVIGTTSTSPVVVATAYNSSTKVNAIASAVRTSGGSWERHTYVNLNTAGGLQGSTPDISVAGNRTATTADHCFVVTSTRVGTTKDMGDVIYLNKVSLTTGLLVGTVKTVTAGFAIGLGAGFRSYWVFNTGSNEFTVAGTVSAAPWLMMAYRFTWNGTTLVATTTVPMSFSTARGELARTPYLWGWNSVAYAGAGKLLFFGKNSATSYSCVAEISGAAVTWQAGWQYWDNKYQWTSGGTVPLSYLTSGASWNFTPSALTALLFFEKVGSHGVYSLQHRSHFLPLAPGRILPAAGSTTSSDKPTLSADFKFPLKYGQVKMKMEWQLATNAGFSTNLRTVLEPDGDYKTPIDTAPPTNAISSATEQVTDAAELYQDVWYIRARSLDQVGSYGPWSSATTFVVAHKPVAADLLPTTGQTVVYGLTGSMSFSWKFTDPSPTDYQTAFQILVEDATTGGTAYDTGKVVSDVQETTVIIPVEFKDLELRWKIRLWDSDDVVGPDSDYRLFSITDPPAPVIISPVGTITTGVPLISWDPGLTGTKTQTHYKATVTRSGGQVWTSGWITSDEVSHQMPLGYLDNELNYTFSVTVRDNFGLEAVGTSSVTTDWPVPDGPVSGWRAWISQFTKQGYVYVSWDSSERDDDFTAWNVYRRKVGDTSWTLMQSFPVAKDFLAFRDYTNSSETSYEYVVVQAVNRFGDIVESPISTTVMVRPSSDCYWLLDQMSQDLSMPLYLVTAESFTDEYEEEEYTIIGRGRHVDIGDRIGYSGTMTSQLRDKFTSGQAKYNYALNPSLSYSSLADGGPDTWTLSTTGTVGNVISEWLDSETPPPTGKQPYRVAADGMDGDAGSALILRQDLEGDKLPGALQVAGTPMTLSVWVYQQSVMDNPNKYYSLNVKYFDESDVLLYSVTSTLLNLPTDGVESSVSPGEDLPGNPTGQWQRLEVSGTAPYTAPLAAKLQIEIMLLGSGSGAADDAYLMLTGVQLETGSRSPFIDGEQLGGEWDAVPYLSWSLSTGYYTARQQRLAIEALKARKTAVYLRNPFGDIWTVVPGNISITRIAGVGKAEFADAEIPYREVGE